MRSSTPSSRRSRCEWIACWLQPARQRSRRTATECVSSRSATGSPPTVMYSVLKWSWRDDSLSHSTPSRTSFGRSSLMPATSRKWTACVGYERDGPEYGVLSANSSHPDAVFQEVEASKHSLLATTTFTFPVAERYAEIKATAAFKKTVDPDFVVMNWVSDGQCKAKRGTRDAFRVEEKGW
jgi:hypothetical protein